MATNFPNSPSNGATHTFAGRTYTYSSSIGGWTAQEGTPVATGTSAPSTPEPGDLWFDSSSATLFFYYADGSSNQWVSVSGPAGPTGPTGATGPAGSDASISVSDAVPSSPSAGQLWWNSSTNKLYIYYTDADSSQWIQASTPGSIGATGPAGATGVISNLDTWRITSDITSDAVPITTWSNAAAYTTLQPTLGTAMSHSSGLFTFPATGYWEVQFFAQWDISGNDNMNIGIQCYESDGTTLRTISQATVGDSSYLKQINLTSYLNITNVSTQKVQFFTNSISNASLEGDSTRDKTYVVFKRIAASV